MNPLNKNIDPTEVLLPQYGPQTATIDPKVLSLEVNRLTKENAHLTKRYHECLKAKAGIENFDSIDGNTSYITYFIIVVLLFVVAYVLNSQYQIIRF